VSLDLLLRAPPGTFLVEPFSKIEMLNTECSSSLNSPPENVLAEIDSYTGSTFPNLIIEGHIRVDSSVPFFADACWIRISFIVSFVQVRIRDSDSTSRRFYKQSCVQRGSM